MAGAQKKVLIVEDEQIVALDLKQRLTAMGYDVVGAVDSGREAIDAAAACSPDFILMDIRLRGEIDGIEASRQIQEGGRARFVFVTALLDEATRARASAVREHTFVLKPFNDVGLRAALEAVGHDPP
jgi:CheY-like chemotaxis protein